MAMCETVARKMTRESGLTLMEMTVVVAIASVVLLASYGMIDDAARTSLFIEARNDLPVMAQAAVNIIQSDAVQARLFFDSDPAGVGPHYLKALKLPSGVTALTDSRLPRFNSSGDLLPDPDATSVYTGNMLLMAKQLSPITLDLGSGKSLLADRYQFEYIYLTKRTNHKFYDQPWYLDLVLGKSQIFADFFQLNGLSATDKTNAIKALTKWKDPVTNVSAPVQYAWDAGKDFGDSTATPAVANSAIYSLATDGTYALINNSTTKQPIDMSTTNAVTTLLKGLSGGRISGASDYSVAFRPSGTKSYPLPNTIPKYAYFDSSKYLFPSGAEFQIVGPSGSRRVLSHLTLMASYSAGKLTSREVEVTTAAH